jgi:hypothetical protein
MKNILLGTFLLIAGCETNMVSEVPTSENPSLLSVSLQSYNDTIEVAKSGATYDSLKPAIAAASAGDVIVVYPGTYNDSTPTSLKNRVDMYFHLGARIVNNKKEVSQDEGTVFWDFNGAVQMNILGHGVFINDTGYLGESFVIDLRKPESSVYAEADSMFGFAMALEVDGGRLTVNCPYVMAYCEHGIRTRNGGFVELTGKLLSCDSCNDGGGQAVYFQGKTDTVIVNGYIHHEGGYGAIFTDPNDTGVFILYGDLTAKKAPAITMTDGKAYLNNSTVKTNGAMKVENLYAYRSVFDQTGSGYVFGKSAADTAYLTGCVGDSGINPAAIWFGDYRQYGMGKVRHRR